MNWKAIYWCMVRRWRIERFRLYSKLFINSSLGGKFLLRVYTLHWCGVKMLFLRMSDIWDAALWIKCASHTSFCHCCFFGVRCFFADYFCIFCSISFLAYCVQVSPLSCESLRRVCFSSCNYFCYKLYVNYLCYLKKKSSCTLEELFCKVPRSAHAHVSVCC